MLTAQQANPRHYNIYSDGKQVGTCSMDEYRIWTLKVDCDELTKKVSYVSEIELFNTYSIKVD